MPNNKVLLPLGTGNPTARAVPGIPGLLLSPLAAPCQPRSRVTPSDPQLPPLGPPGSPVLISQMGASGPGEGCELMVTAAAGFQRTDLSWGQGRDMGREEGGWPGRWGLPGGLSFWVTNLGEFPDAQ